MPTKGTEYELFVKEVYECLNKADGLSDVDIQHDVKLTGAAGVEHQVDVFWTFKKGGVNYRVAVECKDYATHVSKEKIATFHSILHDIGNLHGVFASRMGFQKGAIEYAQKYGIQLMEIRHPIDSDWKGLMRDLQLKLIMHSIGDVHPQIIVNKEKAEEMGVSLPEENGFNSRPDETVITFDEMIAFGNTNDEKGRLTMLDLIKIVQRNDNVVGEGKECLFKFKNGAISVNGYNLPIAAILINYAIRESFNNISICGDDVIKAIVKNITEGTEVRIDRFGRVNSGI